MGLKPDEIYKTTMYDFNMMSKAMYENQLHDYDVMRKGAYLISVYSDLSSKDRKKLTPEKMFKLDHDKKEKVDVDVDYLFLRTRQRRGIC